MSSRRLSKQGDTSSEFFLECKAAFLSIYDDISDKIESKKRLNNVLQQSGRNPTRSSLDKYWPRNTDELSFTDFVDICRKEQVTTADDLMKAFRKIDANGDGYISLDELFKIMNAQGENMSRDDVRKMIDEVDDNKDGRLDYGEMHSRRPVIWRDKIFYDQFTNMIMKTTEESKKCSVKVMERKERKKKREDKLRNAASKLDSDKLSHKTKIPETDKIATPNEIVDEITNANEISESQSDETVLSDSEKQNSESQGLSGSDLVVQGVDGPERKEDNRFGSLVSLKKKESPRGSVASLRSGVKGDNMGSRVSVRTLQNEQTGSQVSVRGTDDLGSKASLKSKQVKTGSQVSVRGTDDLGSKASLRPKQVRTDSQVSVRGTDDLGSKASLMSKQVSSGSQVSLRQASQGSRSSLRPVKKDNMGSETSLRSLKEMESTAQAKGNDFGKPEAVKSADTFHDNDSEIESPKKESPKVSPRSRSDSAGKSSLKKGTTPWELAQKDSAAKETPRRELHSKHDKPPLPDSPKSKDSSADKAKKLETPKTGNNSARSVGEEIDYDDDFDIVSTGRPTPRIDLKGNVGDSPRKSDKDTKEDKKEKEEKPMSEAKKGKDAKESARDVKGNTSNKSVDSHALASTAKGAQSKAYETKGVESHEKEKVGDDRKNSKDERKEPQGPHESGKHAQKTKADQKGKEIAESQDVSKNYKTTDGTETKSSNKSTVEGKSTDRSTVDEILMSSARPYTTDDGSKKNTTSFVEEIFKSSRNTRSVLAREFETISQERTVDQPTKKNELEKNSKDIKSGRSLESTPKALPRKDMTNAETAARNNENSLGSQTSLRSGDKEISAPVPSPRKNVSRLSEEDVPRPSPRVKRDTKGKSPSTKSRDKLPDVTSLQDWIHYTSKGCFFYEEDEIVSHVYSLKLTKPSSVYLSAYPIQEPACLNLPGAEPIDTALFVFDSSGKLVTCTEFRDTKGTYGIKCDLDAEDYLILPYTTGCRFRKRPEDAQDNMKESKLVKTRDEKILITSAFRKALEDIFDLCDLDNNGTMSRDEFNWFNLRTSGEELGEDEWEVVEEKTDLENGEITKKGFIELNEMEAEDAQGDVEDLWITLTSMGMNKGLIMDEACPYRVDVYVEEPGRKRPSFKVTGIESLEKKEYVSEICQYTIGKVEEPTKIRNMKDLYMYTYKNEFRATIVIDNRSRSNVTLQVNCSRSKNVVSNRPGLDHTIEIDPQDTAIAHHLLPKSELSDWTISCSETIHK